eukprot:scaffold181179_cov33-Tisochrysis_lutea.AAC.5
MCVDTAERGPLIPRTRPLTLTHYSFPVHIITRTRRHARLGTARALATRISGARIGPTPAAPLTRASMNGATRADTRTTWAARRTYHSTSRAARTGADTPRASTDVLRAM